VSIVDDETDLAYLYKEALKHISGIFVFAFTDPESALEHFQLNHQNYRVVISDFRMPHINGIQLLEKIKCINPTVIRILISAFEIRDEIFQYSICVDKFMQKPVAMKDMIDEVQMLIGITSKKCVNF
jgi:DNA-binding NtrC family response regulator